MNIDAAPAEVSRTVDAGGKLVAVRIFGSSGPSVVFEAGCGEDSESFVQIARQLSRCATAVLYDRPGTGRSGPRKEPLVLASTVADELDEVLTRAFVPPPTFGRPLPRRPLRAGVRALAPEEGGGGRADRRDDPA